MEDASQDGAALDLVGVLWVMAFVTKPARKQQAPPAPDMAPLTELAKCRPIAAGAHNYGTTPGALRLSYKKIHCCVTRAQ